MSIDSEYKKKVKKPLTKVTITRAWGVPGLTVPGTDYVLQVVSCEIGLGYDQSAGTATIECVTPVDTLGNKIIFSPMDRVLIEQGYNEASTYQTTFFGFVDKVSLSDFPIRQTLECRDILKLPTINFYDFENKKVIHSIDYTYYGELFSATPIEQRYAEVVIAQFLTESGIPETHQYLEQVTISGGVGGYRIVLGEEAPLIFENVTAMDAIQSICDYVGYRIWADPTGIVRLKFVQPYASETASLTYQRSSSWTLASGFVANGELDVDGGNTLVSFESSTTDVPLRNSIDIRGYDDGSEEYHGAQITATVEGSSDYVTDPPAYRRAEIDSELIDTKEMAIWTAQRTYSQLNRLSYTATAVIEGDPRLRIGKTISIIDGDITTWTDEDSVVHLDRKYFLYDYRHTHDSSGFKSTLRLFGGTGVGAPPAENIPPTPAFSTKVDIEHISGDYIAFIMCDASKTDDPDGVFEDLSFVWIGPNLEVVAGEKVAFEVDLLGGTISGVNITLTAIDSGTPAASGVVTKYVELDISKTVTFGIYVAVGTTVQFSPNAGRDWTSATLY